jgi:hypothetical protein
MAYHKQDDCIVPFDASHCFQLLAQGRSLLLSAGFVSFAFRIMTCYERIIFSFLKKIMR